MKLNLAILLLLQFVSTVGIVVADDIGLPEREERSGSASANCARFFKDFIYSGGTKLDAGKIVSFFTHSFRPQRTLSLLPQGGSNLQLKSGSSEENFVHFTDNETLVVRALYRGGGREIWTLNVREPDVVATVSLETGGREETFRFKNLKRITPIENLSEASGENIRFELESDGHLFAIEIFQSKQGNGLSNPIVIRRSIQSDFGPPSIRTFITFDDSWAG